MPEKLIQVRGRTVRESWPADFQDAQELVALAFDGVDYPRIPYGDEREGWPEEMEILEHCHDCDVRTGELHLPGCDVERCPRCREQKITCPCTVRYLVWNDGERMPMNQNEP
jgi:hypothetical protein